MYLEQVGRSWFTLIATIFLLAVLQGTLIAQASKDTLVIRGNVVNAVMGQPMDRTMFPSEPSTTSINRSKSFLQEGMEAFRFLVCRQENIGWV